MPTFIIVLMFFYCGVQYFTGNKGFFSQETRKIELEASEKMLTDLKGERKELEARANFLRSDNLSEDLLEERARLLLGLNAPDAYIIRNKDEIA